MLIRNCLVPTFLTLALGISIAPPSNAAEGDWKYASELYLWGANIDIEAENGTNTEIRFTDVVDDFELGLMASLYASKNHWTFNIDLVYLEIDDSVREPVQPGVVLNDLGVEAWIVTPWVSYQVLAYDKLTLEVLAGARYLWIDVDSKLDFSDPNPPGTMSTSISDGSWDGIVGVRGKWHFSDRWFATYHLDGGTGDSDSTFQALAGIGYQFSKLDVIFGYRYMDWSDTESDALEDFNLSGAIAGVKLRF